MATMVKEKRRERKKTREKSRIKETPSDANLENVPNLISSIEIEDPVDQDLLINAGSSTESQIQDQSSPTLVASVNVTPTNIEGPECVAEDKQGNSLLSCSEACLNILPETSQPLEMKSLEEHNISITGQVHDFPIKSEKHVENVTDNYEYLNTSLERMSIPKSRELITEARESELCDTNAYLKSTPQEAVQSRPYELEIENIVPSAPIFEEEVQPHTIYSDSESIMTQVTKPKVPSMSIEEAYNLFGGKEMDAVKAMSEREEAIVEAGPDSGPEHPLVDLLSTFKSSLRALENERTRLTCSFADEEKSRSTLWKIEKLQIYKKKQCKCGTNVELRANYEHAELMKERMPVARMKLEGLLRDIQDSYCHHQHAAILAHCQIDELISETIETSKLAVRSALFLILQALRVSDDSVCALPAALQRWAAALAAALQDQSDVTQLLFLIHHLFRQSRSVVWAARVVRPRAPDAVTAARTLAALETLLANPTLDTALDCTEADTDEGWEEVSGRGAGGAVSSGALREMDLLALLRAFPLTDILARILLFTHQNIRDARPYEWGDARGGCDVLFACAGVRTLLATLQRASDAHAQYARLKRKLRLIAAAALEALYCLYQSPRSPYRPDMEERIKAELEACFVAAFKLFGAEDLDKLDARLLLESTAKDYCLAYMIGLHDSAAREVDSMLVYTPLLACKDRVRVLTAAAQSRNTDHELARIVMDFLIQTGGKAGSPSSTCKGSCGAAARDNLSRLLSVHPYLRTVALYTIADMAQVSTLDPSIMSSLGVGDWRPQSGELQAVLQHWSQRCPALLERLLMQLDCTPHTGLSLPAQLSVVSFLCELQQCRPSELELCWRVLVRLRPHRACWSAAGDAPPPAPDPADLFSTACALLATSWGHSIPLICSRGVTALSALCVRPRVAVHCLAPIMLLMAHSPESVSLTPQFAEVFTSLLSCGPSLVQRAFGRGGVSGAELLLRLVLSQIEDEKSGRRAGASVLPAWLHALWRVRGAAAVLDAAALAARDWGTLDAHAAILLQDGNAKEHVAEAVRNASVAPLLAECLLRACYTHRELGAGVFGALANTLWEQRVNGQKVHVDNALQKIRANISSEELVIYRCAGAVLAAPLSHPAHLTLWRLLLHLYLQRPPSNMRETGVPVGPLFFSGMIKSRTLTQLIKKLQETATYHRNEADSFKKSEPKTQSTNRIVKSESTTTIDKGLLPALSIKDLTGESSESSDDSDLSETEENKPIEKETEDVSKEIEREKKRIANMVTYHTAAERMVVEMCGWLEDGDRVRASPHHADIARFIPHQALEEAWKDCLSRSRPPPSEELDEFPRVTLPPDTPLEPDKTPLDGAVRVIMSIKEKSRVRSRRVLKSPIEDVDVRNGRALFDAIEKHLKNIETFANGWVSEASRISALDSKLWELVSSLRVPRPLPPVTVACPGARAHNCRPTVFYIERISSAFIRDESHTETENGAEGAVYGSQSARTRPAAVRVTLVPDEGARNALKLNWTLIPTYFEYEREWCISVGAERAIKENRSSWVSAVRALSRARPHAPRTAAALHSIARRIRDAASAISALELVWRASAASAGHCPPARAALDAAAHILAERWVQGDPEAVVSLLSRWGARRCSALQAALCGALVAPRRVPPAAWPRVYAALLRADLPAHALFSYLSKFEMSHWSRSAGAASRREMLTSLIEAQTRHGSAPSHEYTILLELLGLHTAAVVNADELCTVVLQFAHLSADDKLPPRQWAHLVKAVESHCNAVAFDQLGNLLRSLGSLWWQARSMLRGAPPLAAHAAHVASVQTALVLALRNAAVALSYSPERVGTCTWSALQESWSAWVAPHPSTPPILPSIAQQDDRGAVEKDGEYTLMLRRFIACIEDVMTGCPGCEVVILQSAFEWSTACHAACLSGAQDGRVQSSELLAALAALPWGAHPWFYGNAINTAVQICATGDREIMSWCCERWSETDAATLLRDVPAAALESRLATLLYLFTGAPLRHHQHILSEACLLPWPQLPEPALVEALERFFATHHDPAAPYHDLPQFQVLLHACLLRVKAPEGCCAAASRDKRALAVSTWVRAAVAPALLAHVAGHSQALLDTLTDLAPHLEESSNELEELLGRAAVIMCMEPAATAALPVWQSWVGGAPVRLRLACVSAASALTAPAYCALLADTAIKAYLANNDSSWSAVISRWQACSPWREAQHAASRACPHAAYACAASQPLQRAAPTLRALQAANMDFVANEVMIAVWICYACRVALACSTGVTEAKDATETIAATDASATNATEPPAIQAARHNANATSEDEECVEAALGLLRCWASPPRRSLLRLVTLQADNQRATPQHRVLCRLAECVLRPSAGAVEAYELACVAAGAGDVLPWARAARPARLPRLARTLYPAHERYFAVEHAETSLLYGHTFCQKSE